MRIYPAIDLIAGNCVRLNKGNFSEKTIYSNSPVEVALNFERLGCQFLHVVDLDGAKKGCLQQFELLKELAVATNLKLQVGGGVRHTLDIERLLNAGVDRVVIGSQAIAEQKIVTEWLEYFGPQKIILALDVLLKNKIPYVLTDGWQKNSNLSLWELLKTYEQYDLEILCTDISRDGVLEGPNFDLYNDFQRHFPGVSVMVSGGIKSKDDIIQCQRFANVSGVIIGRAIYEQRICLEEIL